MHAKIGDSRGISSVEFGMEKMGGSCGISIEGVGVARTDGCCGISGVRFDMVKDSNSCEGFDILKMKMVKMKIKMDLII